MTSDNVTINSTNFNVDKNGNMTCKSATANNLKVTNTNAILSADGKLTIKGGNSSSDLLRVESNTDSSFSYIQPAGIGLVGTSGRIDLQAERDNFGTSISVEGSNGTTTVAAYGIITPIVTQTSKAEMKKNFKKLENALEIVKNTDIYKYNLISEDDTYKKHIGFIIGENYNYSSEITALDKNGNEIGVDTYSMVSALWKAVQEQQDLIDGLKNEIKILKGE